MSRITSFVVAASALCAHAAVAQDGPNGSPPRRVDLRQTVAIPLVSPGLPSPVPVIEVMINGKGPFRFGIETGAGFSVFNANVIETLGLARSGGSDDLPEFRVDSVSMPGATFIDLPVASLRRSPTGVDGILGLPFFHDVLLTIDYPARVARLEHGTLPASNGRDVISLSKVGPFWALPISFGSLQTRAVLDTRGSSALGVVPALADSMRFTGELQTIGMARGAGFANEVPVKSGVLDGDVRIGQFVFPRPALSVRPLPPPLPQEAIFGSSALQHFIVTLDQRNARLRLARPAGASNVVQLGVPMPMMATAPSAGDMRRMGLAFAFLNGGQRGVRVDMVIPGGLAEQSGFKVGDTLVEVEGKRTADLSEAQFGEILRSWRPITIVVEREGKRVELRVPGR